MAQADAEHGQARGHHVLDHGHGVCAGRRRVARTVAKKKPIGTMGQDVFGGGRCRHHGDLAPLCREATQDVLFGPEIDGDDMVFGRRLGAVALAQFPHRGVPGIGLGAGHVLGQVQALEPGKALGHGNEGRNVEGAVVFIGDDAVGRPAVADQPGQAPGIDPGDRRQVMGFQPSVQMLGRAPAGRIGDVDAHDRPPGRRGDGFHVFRIGADVADMREGKGDDLTSVGRIGEDFLIPGDRGVETDLAHGGPRRTCAAAPENFAGRQHQGRVCVWRLGGHGRGRGLGGFGHMTFSG